ncbi:MAG: sulfite reductase subunit A [bacterium]|nr:sulfite reductase subunit A [bacterium]
MNKDASTTGEQFRITQDQLQKLLDVLRDQGYETVGPTVREGVITYDQIDGVEDLPIGWTDEQEPGKYRLKKRSDKALFGYVVGPHSWKKFVYPPRQLLWRMHRDNGTQKLEEPSEDYPRYAFFGVRSCEIQALAVQDKVFMGSDYRDRYYALRRKDNLIIAVNCVEPGGTCFCASMDTGPKARKAFDLALTEIVEKDQHYFLIESGSDIGTDILSELKSDPATDKQIARADELLEKAARNMGRQLDTTDIKDLLYRNAENRHWEQVAKRCLSCSNCTMVCPTCFCSTVEDTTDLTGTSAERVRRWDSCFTLEFSYIHGGAVRPSEHTRYRHWITHKLASWQDQFGTSGCVGCGRCITWCPVGIDITEEIKSLQDSESLTSDEAKAKE